MPKNKLKTALDIFVSEVNKAQNLIRSASVFYLKSNKPKLTKSDFESIIELSYLKAYISWEKFLEESFTLFLIGETSNIKIKPVRYIIPKNRKHAIEFILQGRDFVDWSSPEEIRKRANLFLKNGMPFEKPIASITHQLTNMKTIRNAITHASVQSKEKFKSLVRGKISYYPHSLTVGGFLYRTMPNTKPPETFFDYYFSSLVDASNKIVH
jgi:hypothetical protein